MAPARRQSNGRSPLVNKQSQITTFFSKSTSSTPSPPIAKQSPKLAAPNPNPNQKPDSSPSHTPTTPSPLQSRPSTRKPVLVIPSSPVKAPVKAAAAKSYGQEVVGKRIKVYWPLDEAWYEGCVKSYDENGKKHLIQYDDAEEELLDLGKEKTEWIEESPRRLKRLRRGGAAALEKVAVVEVEDLASEGSDGNVGGGDDDSSDEDWKNNDVEKEVEEDMDVDLVDEDEDNDGGTGDDEDGSDDFVAKRKGGKSGEKPVLRKRKASGGGNKVGPGKKSKSGDGGPTNEGRNVSSVETGTNISSECTY